MKRLLLTAFLGLTCAQQAHANNLIPASLLSALPSRDTALTCVAGPTLGFAAGTVYTLGRAAHAHRTYDAEKQIVTKGKQYSNDFINTIMYGSQPGGNDEDPQFEPRYINNIGISWLRSIFLGATIGTLYGIYKNGITDGLKIAAGTFTSAWLLKGALSKYICKPYFKADLRTNLYLKKVI